MTEKPMQVPKTWNVTVEFKQAPRHIASFYGFKSREAAQPLLDALIDSPDVIFVEVRCAWKLTRRGRWQEERETIRQGDTKWRTSH